jgi:hypothetical protein
MRVTFLDRKFFQLNARLLQKFQKIINKTLFIQTINGTHSRTEGGHTYTGTHLSEPSHETKLAKKRSDNWTMVKGKALSDYEKMRIVDCYDKEIAPKVIAEVLGRTPTFYAKYVFNATLPPKEKKYRGRISNVMGRHIKAIVSDQPKISLTGIHQNLVNHHLFRDCVGALSYIANFLNRSGS